MQYLLNEIAMCKPESHQRFAMLKRKAKKALAKMREEYPDLRSLPVSGAYTTAWRGPNESPTGEVTQPPHGK